MNRPVPWRKDNPKTVQTHVSVYIDEDNDDIAIFKHIHKLNDGEFETTCNSITLTRKEFDEVVETLNK